MINYQISKYLLNGARLNQVIRKNGERTKHTLQLANLPVGIKEMQYATRGRVLMRAKQHLLEIKQGVKKPFKELILTNLGDAQGVGQPSLTFLRQVLALAICPKFLRDPSFPEDAKRRAKELLASKTGSSLGSNSDFQGIPLIRQHIADYIMNRDGYDPAVDPDDIIITDGASVAIAAVLKLFAEKVDAKPTGCMIPVPQYPLYSATLSALGMKRIDYYLDEENGWALNIKDMKRILDESKRLCAPRILCILNPGNPTGQLISQKNIEEAIKFAYRESLFILADEVYQDNVRGEGVEFSSVRKIMVDMGMPYSRMECISFHSASKGFASECGFRCGYAELFNIHKDIKTVLLDYLKLRNCPNNAGQVILDAIINPPKTSDPSYQQYMDEKCKVLTLQSEKACKLYQLFNTIDGVKCNPAPGALYLYPKVSLPERFLEECQEKKLDANEEFCLGLLDAKGISVVPGSGFGQLPGTYHFRTTILPPIDKLELMAKGIKEFVNEIKQKYT